MDKARLKKELAQKDYDRYIWQGHHIDENDLLYVLYKNCFTKSAAKKMIVSIYKLVNKQLNKDYPIKYLFIHEDIKIIESFKNCDNNCAVFNLINMNHFKYSYCDNIVNVWIDDPLGYYIEVEK